MAHWRRHSPWRAGPPQLLHRRGTGAVIRRTDIIGDHVQAYQAVTLGAQSFSPDEKGNIVKEELRCPIIEEDVTIRSVKGATPKC